MGKLNPRTQVRKMDEIYESPYNSFDACDAFYKDKESFAQQNSHSSRQLLLFPHHCQTRYGKFVWKLVLKITFQMRQWTLFLQNRSLLCSQKQNNFFFSFFVIVSWFCNERNAFTSCKRAFFTPCSRSHSFMLLPLSFFLSSSIFLCLSLCLFVSFSFSFF